MMPLTVPRDLDKYFYNRKKDIKRISLFTNSIYQDLPSQILITGLRGVGKTYLLKKILNDQSDDVLTVYLDIAKIYGNTGGKITEERVLKYLLDELIRKLAEEDNMNLLDKIKTLITDLRLKDFNISSESADVSLAGVFSIPIPVIKNNYQKLSDFVMNLPQKIVDSSEKYKGVIIVIDEFQHLKYLENPNAFFWLLRSYIQEQANVSYILTGSVSKTAEIIEMINGQNGAFGGRMIQIDIEPFSKEETLNYINEKAHEIEFTDDGFDRFYKCTRGIPAYINSFCNVLGGGEIYDDELIKEIFFMKLDQIAILWVYEWGTLNENEKSIVKLLVSNDCLTFSQLQKDLSMSKATLSKYLDYLSNKAIISFNGQGYLLDDSMLKTWLKHKKELNGYYPL